ncbi:MAG TPA: dienelactone hydrolase family protein [Gemmataceae bacterium]|nr:dienelactone hydrolase family protein [Gemmataceae bacterium]
MKPRRTASLFLLLLWPVTLVLAQPLSGTKPLTREGDLAAQMVAGIDRYLMHELDAAVERRQQFWKPDYSSADAYARSVEPNRKRLRQLLGVVDSRLPVKDLDYVSTTSSPALVAEGAGYKVYAVRWPVFDGVDAEGLLLMPARLTGASVVAIPDADWTPEMLVGLAPGTPPGAQFARLLAENGCQVLVPTLIDRADTWSGNPKYRMTNQPHREFVYRMAYEMGRHIIGYEVQKVLAAVDWFAGQSEARPIGVIGYGEGGMVALYSAALDTRIRATVASGYFGPREVVWKEPIYRNVWSFVREFGDAGVAMLVAPRSLIIENSAVPSIKGPPPARGGRGGAAPGEIDSPRLEAARAEAARAIAYEKLKEGNRSNLQVLESALPGENRTLVEFCRALAMPNALRTPGNRPTDLRKDFGPSSRQHRQFDQLCAFTQKLMREGEFRRQEFWARADTSSVEKWRASCKPYRDYFWEEGIGKLPDPTEPMNPQTRLAYDEPRWKGYEVALHLYPDVFAYGILLLPKDLQPGERRPVVVCQHGLEGRPQDVVNPKTRTPYYNSFGAQLADRGYIVYAPQNPYIGQEHFRVLQRKANPLGLSLFSFIVRQHERTLDWLAQLPCVDPERIAFYGLSYGGKTAMRVPAILERYCLSICSGDFNEWIWKNVSQDFKASYMFSGEYEMYEFNLGNSFNYAEMASLIAPRPFMVERGHDDGVGIDEWIAYEYAKVRRLYSRLGIPEHTEIEFFPGGHMVNGKGTFAFLDRQLKWQPPK